MKIDRELILYVIFGFFTTMINLVVFFLFTRILHVNYIFSNVMAWVLSVLFSYVTNRIWVFESENTNVITECLLFFGSRLFAGTVDTGLLFIFIDVLSISDVISKIVVQVIVIVLNYVMSKFIIFK